MTMAPVYLTARNYRIGRFYARDVKVVYTHLTSETLKSSSVKTGRTKVDDLI